MTDTSTNSSSIDAMSSDSAGNPTTADMPYPPRSQAWYCVAILALTVMINFLDRGILTLLVEPIKADLRLSDGQMSLVMGFAFTFFYAILGLPVARLVDRYSRTHIMAIGITIWSVMTAMCGFATSFWHLFFARAGVGVGETTSGPSAYSMLADYFPPDRLPRAIAGMNLGFVAGGGLSLIIGGAVIDFVAHHPGLSVPFFGAVKGWQAVLMLVGLPGLIVAALMLTVKNPPRRGVVADDNLPISEVFRYLAKNWAVFGPLFLGLSFSSAMTFGFQMWGPSFYTRTYGWSPALVGYVSGAALLIAMPIGLFLGSAWSEHLWRKGYEDANMRVVSRAVLVSTPLYMVMPLAPNPWVHAGGFMIAVVFAGMTAPTQNAALQSVTPNRLRGQMTFLYLFTMNVVGMAGGPLLVGMLSEHVFSEVNIRYALVATAVMMGIPAMIVFYLGVKPYGQAMEQLGTDAPPVMAPH